MPLKIIRHIPNAISGIIRRMQGGRDAPRLYPKLSAILAPDYLARIARADEDLLAISLLNSPMSEFWEEFEKQSNSDLSAFSHLRFRSLFSGKLDKRKIQAEPNALRLAVIQIISACTESGKTPIFVIASEKGWLERIVQKVCIALEVGIVEVDSLANKAALTADASHRGPLVFSTYCDWLPLLGERANGNSLIAIRNVCFLAGLPVDDGAFVLIRHPSLIDANIWNDILSRAVEDANKRRKSLVIFDNSVEEEILQTVAKSISKSRFVSLMRGKLSATHLIEMLLTTKRTILARPTLAEEFEDDTDVSYLARALELSQRYLNNIRRFEHGVANRQALHNWVSNLGTWDSGRDIGNHYRSRLLAGSLNAPLALTASKENQIVQEGYQKYLLPAFDAKDRVTAGGSSFANLAPAFAFLQWGASESGRNLNLYKNASAVGGPLFFIEDGFIRSVEIGLGGNPGLSFLIDDMNPYYDARRWSRIEAMLASDWKISPTQLTQSQAALAEIKSKRISKYNHAPDVAPKWANAARKKVLLVDQRLGDQSVPSGLGTEDSFRQMVMDAVMRDDDALVVLKRHPDGTIGGKGSYFSREILGGLLDHPNILIHDGESNPYALFDCVDEVSVVTSGMGFEALIGGVKVNTYGAPFYAGWGRTNDRLKLDWRNKNRRIEDIFYWAYIASSVYYDPKEKQRIDVADICRYISVQRDSVVGGPAREIIN